MEETMQKTHTAVGGSGNVKIYTLRPAKLLDDESYANRFVLGLLAQRPRDCHFPLAISFAKCERERHNALILNVV